MEIESPNKTDLLTNNYYKISYPNQNYNFSFEYKNWKKSMEEKRDKKGREIYCEKDNLIIYQEYENINSTINCPICNRVLYKCQYCNTIRNKKTTRSCYKAYIKEIINRKSIYSYVLMENELDKRDFYILFFLNFIPFIIVIENILIGILIFYFNLENKNDKVTFDACIDKKLALKICLFILVLFIAISIIVSYSIFFYTIYIICVIISLPFKLYPIKLLYGLLNSIL